VGGKDGLTQLKLVHPRDCSGASTGDLIKIKKGREGIWRKKGFTRWDANNSLEKEEKRKYAEKLLAETWLLTVQNVLKEKSTAVRCRPRWGRG